MYPSGEWSLLVSSAMKREDIAISKLLLDAENPRHGIVVDQAAALERLIAISPDHLRNLAEDIAKKGLHPGIDFLVYPNGDGNFVVLDGNRRLAAIKLLTQPEAAPSAWTPIDTKMLVDASSLETLRCTIFESREEGRPWVERMHTGQMGGVGVVQWPPIAQHRFSPRNDQRGRGAAALAWLSSRTKSDAADTHTAIEKVENEITTFGRFVQTTAVRPILGYDFKGSELEPSDGVSEGALYCRLIAAVNDLAGGKDVNDLRTKKQRIEYAHSLAGSTPNEESEPDADGEQPPKEPKEPTDEESPGETDPQETGSEGDEGDTDKKPKTPRPRKPKIPQQKFVLESPLPEVFKPRIVRISEELCHLNVHEMPNAVAVLLRLLIEMTTEQCRRAENLPKKGDLNDHIQNVTNRVQTQQDQQDKVFHGLLVSLQEPTHRDHTRNFNQHVHNMEYHPVPTDLINTTHAYLPYFERIGERLANKTSS